MSASSTLPASASAASTGSALDWLLGRQFLETTCALDIEKTAQSFHAYSIPDDIEIRAGDQMLIHDAPTFIEYGAQFTTTRRATIVRAGWIERVWTHFTAFFELTELYEVGFAPKDTP